MATRGPQGDLRWATTFQGTKLFKVLKVTHVPSLESHLPTKD